MSGDATLAGVMTELQALGTEQNVKVYRRHGAKGEFYGVSFANLNAVAKRLKKRTDLARQLWATTNVDARTLATLVADPKGISREELESWVRDIDYYAIADYFVRRLVLRTPYADELMQEWLASPREYVKRCGFSLLALRALKDGSLRDDVLQDSLDRIRRELQSSPNRAREAMNGALIAIGMRNEEWRARALSVAEEVGPVEIDHGPTDCKTPDAFAELRRRDLRVRRLGATM